MNYDYSIYKPHNCFRNLKAHWEQKINILHKKVQYQSKTINKLKRILNEKKKRKKKNKTNVNDYCPP